MSEHQTQARSSQVHSDGMSDEQSSAGSSSISTRSQTRTQTGSRKRGYCEEDNKEASDEDDSPQPKKKSYQSRYAFSIIMRKIQFINIFLDISITF